MSPRSRSFRSLLSLQTLFAALLILLHCPAFAKSLTAPAQADADSPVKIGFQGADNEREFITILKPDEPEGRYGDYEYTKGDSIELFAPVEPGDYEIRWLGAETPYPTIERQPLKVLPIAAKLQAPASAAIVTDIKVQWEGPNHPRDFITIVSATTPERQYAEYEYTDKGNPLTLQAPTTPGAYEIRYLTGRGYATIGKTAITITDSSASVEFTSPARIGGVLPVKWTGPANEREYITVVKATEPDGRYANYTYVDQGNPVEIQLPETAGAYEVRYMTADAKRVLARAPLQIDAVDASVEGPVTAAARSLIQVKWTGPNNERDFVAITQAGKSPTYITYSYTARGNPVTVEVPREPGDYEIHYLTALDYQSLASAKLKVTPATGIGKLQVVAPAAASASSSSTYATVEVVLDASGSMLQKLDGKRRIDIAKNTLNQLLGTLKTGEQQFALRVFGHRKADACDTELLLPPAPANSANIAATINKLEAKNLARTPIADSLKQVSQDLGKAGGKSLVILLTDGEETCDGDPGAEIKKLRDSGLNVQVSIVGFAIGEYALKQQFSAWAEAGGGTYFDAQDATALQQALKQSLQVSFMVLDAQGTAVASGSPGDKPLELPAGQYRIKVGNVEIPATISPDETTAITLP